MQKIRRIKEETKEKLISLSFQWKSKHRKRGVCDQFFFKILHARSRSHG